MHIYLKCVTVKLRLKAAIKMIQYSCQGNNITVGCHLEVGGESYTEVNRYNTEQLMRCLILSRNSKISIGDCITFEKCNI